MKRSVLSRGSILIVILLIVNMIGTTFPGAYAMSFTENEGVENPYKFGKSKWGYGSSSSSGGAVDITGLCCHG